TTSSRTSDRSRRRWAFGSPYDPINPLLYGWWPDRLPSPPAGRPERLEDARQAAAGVPAQRPDGVPRSVGGSQPNQDDRVHPAAALDQLPGPSRQGTRGQGARTAGDRCPHTGTSLRQSLLLRNRRWPTAAGGDRQGA